MWTCVVIGSLEPVETSCWEVEIWETSAYEGEIVEEECAELGSRRILIPNLKAHECLEDR